jgi:hypothetical protein
MATKPAMHILPCVTDAIVSAAARQEPSLERHCAACRHDPRTCSMKRLLTAIQPGSSAPREKMGLTPAH